MARSDNNAFDVTVDRKELAAVLERIRLLNKGKKPFELTMSFEDSTLVMMTPKITKTVAGSGTADVQIQMSGPVLVRMAAAFSDSATIRFLLDGDHIRIERLTLPCAVIQAS